MAEVAAKRRKLDNDTGAQEIYVSSGTAEPDFAEKLFQLVAVDGDLYPRFPVETSIHQHVRGIRNMPMRDDDVIIAAFPKSGTHWLWEMTQMLVSGRAEYDTRTKHHAMLEFNDLAEMNSLPSPRVMNSHLFLRQLPNEIVTKRSRVIHVMRNPKDLVVSYYFHMRQLSVFHDKGFEEFALDFLNSSGFGGTVLDYFTYMKEMMRWQREHSNVPVLNIYYEDAKKNPMQCVQQLAHFLQLTHATDALCADIADACHFHNLKDANNTVKVKDRPGRMLFRNCNPQLFRNGEVGDWKNYFTMALSERYDEAIEEKLIDCNLSFQFTI